MLPTKDKILFLPPATIFDISRFYTDCGPEENWDQVVENKSKSMTEKIEKTGPCYKRKNHGEPQKTKWKWIP